MLYNTLSRVHVSCVLNQSGSLFPRSHVASEKLSDYCLHRAYGWKQVASNPGLIQGEPSQVLLFIFQSRVLVAILVVNFSKLNYQLIEVSF